MTGWLKRLAQGLLGEYELYRVFFLARRTPAAPPANSALSCVEVAGEAIASSVDELIRQQAWYAGPGAIAHACFDGQRIVGVCFFWFGDRYRTRNFWPLKSDEAKLVQIVTVPDMRGRGIARALIEHGAARMFELGFRHLFARVWHSNTPSTTAFRSAGWSTVALVFTFNPLRLKKPWRIQLPWPQSG